MSLDWHRIDAGSGGGAMLDRRRLLTSPESLLPGETIVEGWWSLGRPSSCPGGVLSGKVWRCESRGLVFEKTVDAPDAIGPNGPCLVVPSPNFCNSCTPWP